MLAYKYLQDASAFRLYCKAIDMKVEQYDEVAKNLDDYRENPKWKDIIEESKHFIGVVESIAPSPCSMLLYSKPLRREIGLVRTKEGVCVNIDGYHTDKFKYLKNDYLQVKVWEIIRRTCELANIKIPSIGELEKLLDDKTYDIYKNKLTCTINQADSKFATDLIAKYQVSSVDEMSAFVASIRPGFASLLDNFIERKPYTTGVEELDNILKDSYHYLMYQESIMKYLIWLGVKESESYDIIKKIAKKKFKEKELRELKIKLKEGWKKQVGREQGFEETWQVVEDASRYSFNASHSLSYAYDSLYGAYLKAHYPLEYYTTVFTLYDEDIERTGKLTNELEFFGIKLKQPKFRYSKADYFMNKETNSIYKGVASIKYLNATVADELYELKDNKYDTFLDLLIDLQNTSINSRQLEILIRLGYFSEFGGRQYLLNIVEIYNKYGKKKTFKKTELPLSIELMRTVCEKETDKQFSKPNNKKLCELLINCLDDEDMEIKDIIMAELEFCGTPSYKTDKLGCRTVIALDLSTKYTPVVDFYNLSTGGIAKIKISKKVFKSNVIEKGDIVELGDLRYKPKKKKINGEWVEMENEFDLWCDNYKIIKNKLQH